MERWWFEERVVAPVRALADALPSGVVLTDDPPGIGVAVEGLFRSEVLERWAGWPPEWTTDGMAVDLAWRRDRSSVAVAGRLWVDFSGNVTLVLVVFTIDARGVGAVVHVGVADPPTGRPPSIRADGPLLDGSAEGEPPVPHMAVRRRLVPVVWTEVAVVRPDALRP
ncbi:MAG TPA: hypothetical protein VF228_01985 [Iamia sp.]